MEVCLVVAQTYTTVTDGHLMNADLSCMIQNEPIGPVSLTAGAPGAFRS